MKYGVTRHNVLGVEAVLATGEVIECGGKRARAYRTQMPPLPGFGDDDGEGGDGEKTEDEDHGSADNE